MFVLFAILLLLSASLSAHAGPTSARGRFFGSGTWYAPGRGACGSHATDKDYIVAINRHQYHKSNICYKEIHITNTKNGKSVTANIQDECSDCTYGSLDMSPAVFVAIADSGLPEGQIPIAWTFSGAAKRASDSLASTAEMLPAGTGITSTTPDLGPNEGSAPPNAP